jgi:hypothetical protein
MASSSSRVSIHHLLCQPSPGRLNHSLFVQQHSQHAVSSEGSLSVALLLLCATATPEVQVVPMNCPTLHGQSPDSIQCRVIRKNSLQQDSSTDNAGQQDVRQVQCSVCLCVCGWGGLRALAVLPYISTAIHQARPQLTLMNDSIKL